MDTELLNRCAMPAIALALGGALLNFQQTKTAGRLLCFLGAQTGMILYMKQVLSNQAVSEGRNGFPAAFAVTGLQQLTGFVLMMIWMAVSRFTPYRYVPKKLSSWKDYLAVLLFSGTFTANIGLNNYSMSLIPISVNLIIRSCSPVPTFLAQKLVSWYTRDGKTKDSSLVELTLMLLGCLCACVAVVAKTRSSGTIDSESRNLVWGVTVCVISCFAGSTNLVLAGMMGTSLKLDEFDTVTYLALPATALLIPAMSVKHAVNWEEGASLSDWDIAKIVWDSNPSAVYLAVLSGVFALAFNLLNYGVVQQLSATHTAFAGNFNKAFNIVLAMVQGLEPLPADGWGWLMVAACMGNISAFTAYNIAKLRMQSARDGEVASPRDAEKEPLRKSTSDSTGDEAGDCSDDLETRSSSEEDDWESIVAPGSSCLSCISAARSPPAVGLGGQPRAAPEGYRGLAAAPLRGAAS